MRIPLFLLLFFTLHLALPAQRPDLRQQPKKTDTNGNGVNDEDEDDEDEDAAWEGRAKADFPKYAEALVLLDGKEMKMSDQYTFMKNKVIQIAVSRLLPGSYVELELEKVGVGITKTRYQSNENGELELEVKTGKAKGKASVILKYTPSDGKPKSRKAYIKIE